MGSATSQLLQSLLRLPSVGAWLLLMFPLLLALEVSSSTSSRTNVPILLPSTPSSLTRLSTNTVTFHQQPQPSGLHSPLAPSNASTPEKPLKSRLPSDSMNAA